MRLVLVCSLLSALAAPAAAIDAGPTGDAAPVPTRPAREQVIDFSDEEAMGAGEMVVGEDPTPVEHDTLMPERYRRGLENHPGEVEDRGCAGCAAGRDDTLVLALAALALLGVRRRHRR